MPYTLEVPQLWNERGYSQIQVENGTIVKDVTGQNTQAHGVYGGVHFNLDRFDLSSSVRQSPSPTRRPMLPWSQTRPVRGSIGEGEPLIAQNMSLGRGPR